MNRAYRLVFNRNLQIWVVAHEKAKGHTRSGRSQTVGAVSTALGACLTVSMAFAAPLPGALPSGAQVTAGTAQISTQGAQMTVQQQSDRLITNWQSFDIGSQASVNFVQPSASSVALNRITSQSPTEIAGRLTANGQVMLVNAAGIVFGQGSQVNVGSLVASSLDVADQDFMQGKSVFAGAAGGTVVNLGSISVADGGLAALIAPSVRNDGLITARMGQVVLAGGSKVTLDFSGSGLSVKVDSATVNQLIENRGLIVADGGEVVMTHQVASSLLSAVINQSGTVQARSLESRDGRILLLGDMESGKVTVDGILDASAPVSGNGGFVETSAASVKLADSAKITTAAAQGVTGQWLLDPQDLTIAASGGDMTGTALSAQLALNNVTLSSEAGATAGNGDIVVNDGVSWSADTVLTLSAGRNVNVNAVVEGLGDKSGVALNVMRGDYNFGMGGKIRLPAANASFAVNGQAYTLIHDVQQLQDMDKNLNGFYALGNDVDASETLGWNEGKGFQPIATYNPAYRTFSGRFYGLANVIANLSINRPDINDYDPVGLFSRITRAKIRDLDLISVNAVGKYNVGGLIGYSSESTVRNVDVSGIVKGDTGVGGAIGSSYSSGIDKVSFQGKVLANKNPGGLLGGNTIPCDNCYYNIDGTEINGRTFVGQKGLFASQFNDWIIGGKSPLKIENYSSTLPFVDGYYLLSSVQSLKDVLPFASRAGYSYKLASDIDLKGTPGFYIPVFSGSVFDGAGYAIKNMSLYYPELSMVGFFGRIYGNDSVVIKDLSIINANVTGLDYVGLVVGQNSNGWDSPRNYVENINVSGIVQGSDAVGGLVGFNNADIVGVVTDATVRGKSRVGGIVGVNDFYSSNVNRNYVFSKSYFSGEVEGAGEVGGVIGEEWEFWGHVAKSAYYNIDAVKINGAHAATKYGLYTKQYQDWLAGDKESLSINNYSDTIPYDAQSGYYMIGSVQSLKDMLPFAYGDVSDPHGGGFKFKLSADIDLASEMNFSIPVFAASEFDGNNHIVSNVFINNPLLNEQGFIGALRGEVKNVELKNVNVVGGGFVGGLVGNGIFGGSISNVTVQGVVTGGSEVGGIAGQGRVSGGTFSGSVNGVYHVGGLVGDRQVGVSNSYFDIDDVAINGTSHNVTADGIYPQQYADWIAGGKKPLDIKNYSSTIAYDAESQTYNIGSAQGLKDAIPFAMVGGYNFRLSSNIDLSSDEGFSFPILASSFDGAGHTVSNLKINSPTLDNQGFFGQAYNDAGIKNLNLTNVDITGRDYVGGLVGSIFGSIEKVVVSGKIQGRGYVGGITGYQWGHVSQTATFGSVTGSYYVGGVTGGIDTDGELIFLDNSYSASDVSGDSGVGGLLGNGNNFQVSNSYSSGYVLKEGVSIGGLIGGSGQDSSVSNSFWLKHSLNESGGSARANGTGKTLDEMQSISTFNNWDITAQAGESIWRLYDGKTMPMLRYLLKPVTVSAGSKVYDGKILTGLDGISCANQACDPSNVLGVVTLEDGSQNVLNVGEYGLDLHGLYSNQLGYDFTYGANALTITAAPLDVKVNHVEKVYDGQTYSGSAGVTYSGFVNGETDNVLTGTLAYGGTAQGVRNVGEYSLTASGQTAANYTLSYVDGKLTINPAAITIAAVPDSKSYDGNSFSSMAPVVIGLKGTDSITGLLQAFNNANAGLGNSLSVVGYTVNDGNNGENYTISTNAAVGQITPATLAVSVINAQKVYDGQIYSGGVGITYNGFVNGETESVLTGILTYGGTAQGARNVGKYSLTASGQSAANYALTYVDGQLNLSPRNLNLDFTNRDKTYDATTAAHLTVLDDRISGDQLIVNYQSALYVDKNVGTGKFIDINGIEATGVDAANYQFHSSTSTTGNITPKELSVSGLAIADKIPDGTNSATPVGSGQLTGVLTSDNVRLDLTHVLAMFSSIEPEQGISVNLSGLRLSGTDAENYLIPSNLALTGNIKQNTRAPIPNMALSASIPNLMELVNQLQGQLLTQPSDAPILTPAGRAESVVRCLQSGAGSSAECGSQNQQAH